MRLPGKYAEHFLRGKKFGRTDQNRLDRFLEATKGLDRDVAFEALEGGMTFGAPDRARYDALMAKRANKKSAPSVPGPVGTSTPSINPFNTQPDSSVFRQPTENRGPTVPAPPAPSRPDPKPAPTPSRPDPEPAPTSKTKVKLSFKKPKTEYQKTINAIEKDFNKGNISEAKLGQLKEEAAQAEYGPKADLSQFNELLGELEDSKMKQQRQKSIEGRRDIFAEGAASMMSNF